MSSRTRDLGQILQSVENLLHRCVSKYHGAFLKHTETPKTPEDMGKGYGLGVIEEEGSGGPPEAVEPPAGPGGATSSVSFTSLPPASKLLAKRGSKNMADLRVIGAYIVDFGAIAASLLEEQGGKKAGADMTAAATTGTAGPPSKTPVPPTPQ